MLHGVCQSVTVVGIARQGFAALSLRSLTAGSVLLLLCLPATRAQGSCDSTCQSAQREALLQLYDSTNGPSWFITAYNGDTSGITKWGSEGLPGLPLPAHCYWAFVICCGADGQYAVPAGYPTAACSSPFGIEILPIERNGLSGTLPTMPSFWDSIGLSLANLDLSGAPWH